MYRIRIWLALVLICLGCAKQTGPLTPVIINQPSEQSGNWGSVKIDSEGGKLNYRISLGDNPATIGPAEAQLEPDSGWFVYVEDEGRFWVYEGGDVLKMYRRLETGGSGSYQLSPNWDTLPLHPPADLIERLPDTLRKIIRQREPNKSLNSDSEKAA